MPTYDYRCNACDHEFELFQSMRDPVKKKCPACGKSALERLIGTGAAILFKGDGFYQTDYRSESYKKAAEADKKSTESTPQSPKSDSAPEKKPDSKPESQRDAKPASRPVTKVQPRAAKSAKTSAPKRKPSKSTK